MFHSDWPFFKLSDGIDICLFGISLLAIWHTRKSAGIAVLGFNFMWREE